MPERIKVVEGWIEEDKPPIVMLHHTYTFGERDTNLNVLVENQLIMWAKVTIDNNEEEQILYYYDKEQDKYVYNDKHPGHGGGGVERIGFYLDYDNLEIDIINQGEFCYEEICCTFIGVDYAA